MKFIIASLFVYFISSFTTVASNPTPDIVGRWQLVEYRYEYRDGNNHTTPDPQETPLYKNNEVYLSFNEEGAFFFDLRAKNDPLKNVLNLAGYYAFGHPNYFSLLNMDGFLDDGRNMRSKANEPVALFMSRYCKGDACYLELSDQRVDPDQSQTYCRLLKFKKVPRVPPYN